MNIFEQEHGFYGFIHAAIPELEELFLLVGEDRVKAIAALREKNVERRAQNDADLKAKWDADEAEKAAADKAIADAEKAHAKHVETTVEFDEIDVAGKATEIDPDDHKHAPKKAKHK